MWTPEAQQDRFDIWESIASDNRSAAARMDTLLSDAAAQLEKYPKLGRPGAVSGTHELIPHESYRRVYEIERETVWILALVHTARRWPAVRK